MSASVISADQETPDIIVIGAGIAGLAAARSLHSQGVRVTVLEARDRIGGRLWTHKSTFSTPVDLGGSWIHGSGGGNPLTRIAKEHNIVTEKTDYDNSLVYDELGRKLPDYVEEKYEVTYERLFKSVLQMRKEHAKAHCADISVGEALHQCRRRCQLTPAESKYLDMAIKSEIEYEYASDVNKMSLRMFETDEEFPGPDAVFPNGYNQVTDVLAASLSTPNSGILGSSSSGSGGKIVLECVVHRVKYPSAPQSPQPWPPVEVHTNKGVFRARRAVITLPLGVLQADKVQFEPPLPQPKLAVMRKMHMGQACKVFLEFPSVFWPKNHMFYLVSPVSDRHLDVFNVHAYNNGASKILMVYYGGSEAERSESMSEETVVNEIMTSFRVVWGQKIPNPTTHLRTMWGRDPFSLGAYSYAGVGVVPEDYAELAATVGDCLYFAGEATSRDYVASATGAYLSGESAAQRVLVDCKK